MVSDHRPLWAKFDISEDDDNNFKGRLIMLNSVYIFGIGISLILGIWNIINNGRINKRTTFINSVTAERVKWIGKLRENISTFCGLTNHWVLTDIDSEESTKIIKELDKLKIMIKLQVNPQEDHGKKIMELIDEIPELTNKDSETISKLNSKIDEVVSTSQSLLKEEWDKVKMEAKKGDISKKRKK